MHNRQMWWTQHIRADIVGMREDHKTEVGNAWDSKWAGRTLSPKSLSLD